eukprot:jgi/Psemu1/43667/gm1.43667_g
MRKTPAKRQFTWKVVDDHSLRKNLKDKVITLMTFVGYARLVRTDTRYTVNSFHVPFTSSTPAVHNSHPTTACRTPDHPTAGSPETSIGIHGIHKSDLIADSTSTGTSSYTRKYSPSTDSVGFRRIPSSSTPSIVPADIPTGDVP